MAHSPARPRRHPARRAVTRGAGLTGTADSEGTLRKGLLAVLGLGLVGTAAELLLLEHFEDVWQLVPLALIGLALLAIGWRVASPGPRSLSALRLAMVLLVVCGPLGLLLHYRGNSEFALESTPALSGLALFREAMSGGVPALAPGAMTMLGLLGLIYAIRDRKG